MNKLVRIAEFRSILQDYHPSEAALRTLSQTKLGLLVGVSGGGRNTILNELIKTGYYYHIVSDTTRELRVKDGIPIEQNGREYWFRSEEYVLDGLRNGEYMEAAIIHNQQVSGWSVREVEEARKQQKIAIKDITPDGAATAYRLKPEASIIFVLPPSFKEWQRRVQSRGEMEAGEYKRRMESACEEFETALKHDYYQFVINDTTQDAIEQINQITRSGMVAAQLQQKGRELIERLLAETKTLLKAR